MLDLPEKIKKIIEGKKFNKEFLGCSGDDVYNFDNKYILKISDNKKTLRDEFNRINFFNNVSFPSSKCICYIEENNKCYLLRTCINGDSLISDRFLKNPMLLIDVLKSVVDKLKELDKLDCPFKSKNNIGNEFVHGDLCLPNIYVDSNNNFIGFIDVDNSGLGDRWYDYAWLLWSFEYNLKTNLYNDLLLKHLKITFDKNKYFKYIPKDCLSELNK